MKNLSIIIPVYNTDKYLEKCLDSVCGLRHDVDIILIDDGSTDNSGYICDLYEKKDNRIRVIHKENEGLVRARKTGLDVVKTKSFTFVDSDDYVFTELYDDMLDELIEKQYPEADIVCFGMIEEYGGKRCSAINQYENGVYTEKEYCRLLEGMLCKDAFFSFGILPNAVCKIYNTRFVRESSISINPKVRVGEDADLTYQLILQAGKVQVLNRTPYCYAKREDSMMNEKVSFESIQMLENDLKKAFESSKFCKEKLLTQLEDYVDFLTLLYDPVRLFGDTTMFDGRIALYGAGGVGKSIKHNVKKNFTIWVDQNSDSKKGIDTIESLIRNDNLYDKVFIAISNVDICKSVKKHLVEMGVKKPIFYYRDFDQK